MTAAAAVPAPPPDPSLRAFLEGELAFDAPPSKGGDGALAAFPSTLAHDFDDADVDLSGICAWLEAGAADADPPAFAFDPDAGDARDAARGTGRRRDGGAVVVARRVSTAENASPRRASARTSRGSRQGARVSPSTPPRDDAGDAAHFAESPKNGNDAAGDRIFAADDASFAAFDLFPLFPEPQQRFA